MFESKKYNMGKNQLKFKISSVNFIFNKVNQNSRDGFIALISAVIISAIILIFTVTLSYSSFFVRYSLLDSEYKDRSMALADGCIDYSLLKYANDSSYLGNENLAIGSDSCFIRPIQVSGNNFIIQAQAVFQNSHTNLQVTFDKSSLVLISWTEIPNF